MHPFVRRALVRSLFLLLALASGAGAHLSAQSLLTSNGLGLPIDPVDARVRALGSAGVGLFGTGLMQGNPAGMAGLALPVIAASFQPTWGTFQRDGEQGDLQGTRFPVMGFAYPIGGLGAFSLSYGGVLDQRYVGVRSGMFQIGGDSVAGTDRFVSRGGVSQARLGWAYRPLERLGVGIELGQYTGLLNRSFTRTFDSTAVGNDVTPFFDEEAWVYSGTSVTLGAMFDPVPIVRVGGSITFGGTLKATPEEGTEGGVESFGMPTELRLGVSSALTNRLMATAGVRIADWTGVDPQFEADGISGSGTTLGGGLEWGGPSLLGRTWPLRVGYRRSDLPFGPAGTDPTESTVSFGFGFNLAQLEEFPLAALDVGFEQGSRTAGPLDESFWRATVSLRVSGR